MNKELLDRRKKRNSYRIKTNNKNKRPILNVFKSNKNIYAQIVDLDGNVLVSTSSKDEVFTAKDLSKKSGIEIAEMVGKEIAKKALEQKINQVAFNKGPYLYIGRVKALADSARENGLEF
ncbi:MAG: 50S ribosomal protein L18 [Rickettsiales bacterium]|nr:50S ribosomal protein L18 [Rickettsiales bacterium]